MTFRHAFNRKLSCTLRITDEPPEQGASHVIGFTWEGQPTSEIIPEYVRWLHVINQTCTDRWSMRIGYVVQTEKNTWQVWYYEPGTAPKLAKTLTA